MNENLTKYLSSEILIVKKINIVVFLVVTQYVSEYTFFKVTYWLHLCCEDAGSMLL
jgi:hypothetical protein